MINRIDWEGTPAYEMENSQLIVRICPALGSNVYSIWDKTLGREILRAPSSPQELADAPVQYGTPILMPPNRIRGARFSFEGREYRFDVTNSHGHHVHGMLRGQAWTVTATGEREGASYITSVLRLAADAEVQRQYPHDLELELTCELKGGVLRHILRATNHGELTAPFGYGLHTWFRLDGEPGQWTLQLPASSFWELDETKVPTGTLLPLGDAYSPLLRGDTLEGYDMDTVFQIGDYPRIAVLCRKGIELRYSASDAFKQWVVFTKGAARDFICLEPYTWVTDAPNLAGQPPEVTGLRGIAPGEQLTLGVKLEVLH
ncbi:MULTISPECIES: aldose 1-epimerase [Paenibacillus]|uniref:aldose 1-epimerase n=1 Tax=Paenibacillus TaxID=44249 RepID=UPI0022B8E8F4|nr:aldose 1-epimerase [Paenibacillus caseinilyticus]MCZ8522769.1 aldose 1-epimerase [Paenibacillus caseinilyticus]